MWRVTLKLTDECRIVIEDYLEYYGYRGNHTQINILKGRWKINDKANCNTDNWFANERNRNTDISDNVFLTDWVNHVDK